MKNKKGFTLIELLAVIIILGILMIIAIPSVTNYISNSRKSTYVNTAKEVISAARNLVNSGELEMYDTDVTYYIPNSCIKVENGEKAKSPYGEFIDDKTYVVVTYKGSGYEYYWVSLDETGTGVVEPKGVDELEEKYILSDVKREDIKDNLGIGDRSRVIIYNSDCSESTGKDAYSDAICKRATTLHTKECTGTSSGCYKAGYYVGGNKNKTLITYGSLGTKGLLAPGDAFDCDVNNDGEFDSITERFYYIGSDDNNVILYYYTNVFGGDITYNSTSGKQYATLDDIKEIDQSISVADNWHGPVTAYKELPGIDNWSNPKLLQFNDRQILNENNTSTTSNGEFIIQEFTYKDRAARLVSYQDLKMVTNNSNLYSSKVLYDYPFLIENTLFDNNGRSFWLETPRSNKSNCVIYIDTNRGYIYGSFESISNTYGIRPVIEIKKKDINY